MNIRKFTGDSMEELVGQIEAAGLEWAEAKLRADLIEEDMKPYLAMTMNELPDGLSEAARDRLARGSLDYRNLVIGMCHARAQANRCKVKYDNLQSLLDVKRSENAMERSKIEKGIYHMGGGR